MTPLGELLDERDIPPRIFGEALALAERRVDRIKTGHINMWIWGHREPARTRQEIIAELLKVSVDDLFPNRPKRPKPGSAAQQLLDAAAEYEPEPPDTSAGARHLIRAVGGRDRLPSTDSAAIPSIHYRAQKRARPIPGGPQRRAA